MKLSFNIDVTARPLISDSCHSHSGSQSTVRNARTRVKFITIDRPMLRHTQNWRLNVYVCVARLLYLIGHLPIFIVYVYIFLSCTASRLVLRTNQPLTTWVMWALFQGWSCSYMIVVTPSWRQGHEWWSCTSTSPPVFMAWCLINGAQR
jgi:hypothetical protein